MREDHKELRSIIAILCHRSSNSPKLLLPKKRLVLVEEVGGGGFWICEAVGARDWRMEYVRCMMSVFVSEVYLMYLFRVLQSDEDDESESKIESRDGMSREVQDTNLRINVVFWFEQAPFESGIGWVTSLVMARCLEASKRGCLEMNETRIADRCVQCLIQSTLYDRG